MSIKCPNGHNSSLERVDMPNTSTYRLLCRKCGAEAVFKTLIQCRCGCKQYTFHPLKGQDSKPLIHREAVVNCIQCGRALADEMLGEIGNIKSELPSIILRWILLLIFVIIVIIVIRWII